MVRSRGSSSGSLSAWKKFALTAPTELPRMSAICWCDSSWYARRSASRAASAAARQSPGGPPRRARRVSARVCVPSIGCLEVRSLQAVRCRLLARSTRLRQTLTAMRYSQVDSAAWPWKFLRPRQARTNASCERSLASSWLLDEAEAHLVDAAAVALDDARRTLRDAREAGRDQRRIVSRRERASIAVRLGFNHRLPSSSGRRRRPARRRGSWS